MTSAGSAWRALASGGRPPAATSRPMKGGVPVQAGETLAPDKGAGVSGHPPSLPQIERKRASPPPRGTRPHGTKSRCAASSLTSLSLGVKAGGSTWKRGGSGKPQQNAAAMCGPSLVERSWREAAVDRSTCSPLLSSGSQGESCRGHPQEAASEAQGLRTDVSEEDSALRPSRLPA